MFSCYVEFGVGYCEICFCGYVCLFTGLLSLVVGSLLVMIYVFT